MSKSRSLSASPNKKETLWGLCYLVFQMFFLPGMLIAANDFLRVPLTEPELNFMFFGINFVAVVLIFRSYLSRSFSLVFHNFGDFWQSVVLGFVAYYACAWCIDRLLSWIAPGFTNANDASIAALSRGNYFLMAIGTVILVPPVEECFYRGLIFRNLYVTSRLAAYLLSMAVFSMIHIVGFLGSLTYKEILICFLQYLPAGFCLAWSYAKSDTIYAPIVIHALVNAMGIYRMR